MLAQLEFQIVVDPVTENFTNLMKLLWFFSRDFNNFCDFKAIELGTFSTQS